MEKGEFSKRKLLLAVKEGRLKQKELRKVLDDGMTFIRKKYIGWFMTRSSIRKEFYT